MGCADADADAVRQIRISAPDIRSGYPLRISAPDMSANSGYPDIRSGYDVSYPPPETRFAFQHFPTRHPK
eukprot:365716-Chlamydomonas_euryale.AAC.1